MRQTIPLTNGITPAAPAPASQEEAAVRPQAVSTLTVEPTPKPVSDAVAVVPLVYSRQQFAQALGIDVATLDRWDSAGKIGPRPLRISGPRGRKLYGRAEVQAWIDAGCPAADEWRARLAARKK